MTDKILNSFDVWIGAQGWKSKLRLRSVDNVSHEGIERLRELILELAILGKLLPQDTSDENANALLKNIAKERYRLIGDGELKKQKLLPEITENEKPFELPKGWAWAKLGNIGDTNIGLTYSPKDISDRGIPVLRSSNVQNGQISLDDLVRVSSKVDSKNFVENGDLLICARNGSKKLVGKCALIKNLKERMSFGAFMAIFRSPLNFYIKYFLESPFYRNRLEGVSTTTINQITQDNLKNTVIPLPPLPEQHRIVVKVDELMALCDDLEQQETKHLKSHQLLVETLLGTLTQAKDAAEFQTAWATLAKHFDDLFITEDSIDQLKQTILQLAVMGKLVPQDLDDEPARVLLDRITKEKERFIKDGLIRKEKPMPEIQDSEKPFTLPFGWEWARPDDFSFKITDGEHFRPETQNQGIYFLSAKDITEYGVSLEDPLFISQAVAKKALQRCNPEKGDILIVSRGATVGRMCVVDIDDVFCLLGSVILLKPLKPILSEYLKVVMKTPQAFMQLVSASGSTAQPAIYLRDLKKILFPIAPLAEQQRIVNKVNMLLELCDRLKERIAESQTIKNDLANAVLGEV